MKKVKQILYIFLFVLLCLLIGYLCFTGNQLSNIANNVAKVGGVYA